MYYGWNKDDITIRYNLIYHTYLGMIRCTENKALLCYLPHQNDIDPNPKWNRVIGLQDVNWQSINNEKDI